ncbi:ScbA/BarX family gamma-butyrolactone biosynthesis protein [Streptomyces sp. CA-111067]|uniref:ScbA/BarX family gamma-butyrolactone biosynthesis protein n=1 Tax=Streptomyces sp. CA-111067 TaxID=3240046 RepID=UPI003D95140C
MPASLGGDAVARRYVHKAAMAEVLLTGWQQLPAPDAFVVTAQWPRAHSFYSAHQGLHDPLLLVETVRQSMPLLSHVAYDVPFGHHLVWNGISFRVDPEALRIREVCAEVTLHITCHEVRYRRGQLSSLGMTIRAERDGEPLGVADAGFTSVAPAIYNRLRAGNTDALPAMARAVPPPPAIPAAQVARYREQDVVLASTDTPNRWQLRADTTHPVIFDHPVDHVPGMLLLEAARQAAQATTGADSVLLELNARFNYYAELHRPCWVEAVPPPAGGAGDSAIRVSVHQDGDEAFSASCSTTRSPAAAIPG